MNKKPQRILDINSQEWSFFLVVQNFMISITFPPPRIPVTNEGLFWDSQSPNDVLPRKLTLLPEKWLLEVRRWISTHFFLLGKRIRKWWNLSSWWWRRNWHPVESWVFGLAVLSLEVGNHSHLYFSGCGTRFGRFDGAPGGTFWEFWVNCASFSSIFHEETK